jgi:hypothetical protein
MGKNIIVSEDTIRDLLEAHASLSAWYYELTGALRAAHAVARTPDDAARSAFVERLAADFPELAGIARTIKVPRMFVPPPPKMSGPMEPTESEDLSTLIEPAQQRFRESSKLPPAPAEPSPSAPPIVDPSKVKY